MCAPRTAGRSQASVPLCPHLWPLPLTESPCGSLCHLLGSHSLSPLLDPPLFSRSMLLELPPAVTAGLQKPESLGWKRRSPRSPRGRRNGHGICPEAPSGPQDCCGQSLCLLASGGSRDETAERQILCFEGPESTTPMTGQSPNSQTRAENTSLHQLLTDLNPLPVGPHLWRFAQVPGLPFQGPLLAAFQPVPWTPRTSPAFRISRGTQHQVRFPHVSENCFLNPD